MSGLLNDRYQYEYLPRDEAGEGYWYGNAEYVGDYDDADTLILVRTNHQKDLWEELLQKRFLPYRIEGGRPSLFDSYHANAVRAVKAITAGADVTKPLYAALRKYAQNGTKRAMDEASRGNLSLRDFLMGKSLWRILCRPKHPWSVEYLSRVDLDDKPNIRISTIHAAKGKEADRVILHLSTTKRIQQGFHDFRDAEIRCWYVGVTRAKQRLDLVLGREPLLPWNRIVDGARHESATFTSL